jgi:hypothetical protein
LVLLSPYSYCIIGLATEETDFYSRQRQSFFSSKQRRQRDLSVKLIMVARLRISAATSAFSTRLHGLVFNDSLVLHHTSQDADRVMATKDTKNDVHITCGRDK